MTTIYAKHLPYEDGRLGEVGREMDVAGAPTIRAVEVAGNFYAIEGSHRLAQAHHRGLIPRILILSPELPGDPRIPVDLPKYEFPYLLVLRDTDFAGVDGR
jgi:hypothetical protein